jgi:hypothetical protein
VATTVALAQVVIVAALLYADSVLGPLAAGVTTAGLLVIVVLFLWSTGFVTGGGRHESVRGEVVTPAVESP